MLQAGFSPDEDSEYFQFTNPPSHTMALELTQPATEMSTSNLPGE
jgi:hypothetical protein